MHHCQKLLLTCSVLLFSLLHTLTLKCNGPTPLHQQNAKAIPASITDDLKGVVEAQARTEALVRALVDTLKCCVALL